MANCMKEVGKLLGVELKEIFCIEGDGDYYRLTDTQLELSCGTLHEDMGWQKAPNTLTCLLAGKLKIIKLSWKPKEKEPYYYSCPSSHYLYASDNWDYADIDEHRYKHGLIFRTKEEAIDMAKKMLSVTQEVHSNG